MWECCRSCIIVSQAICPAAFGIRLVFGLLLGHIAVLQWLIRHGAKAEKDDLGGTPLHDAAEHGQKEVGRETFKCSNEI